MTTEQSLQILDQATAMARLSRDQHVQVQQALAELKKCTECQEPKDNEKGKKK